MTLLKTNNDNEINNIETAVNRSESDPVTRRDDNATTVHRSPVTPDRPSSRYVRAPALHDLSFNQSPRLSFIISCVFLFVLFCNLWSCNSCNDLRLLPPRTNDAHYWEYTDYVLYGTCHFTVATYVYKIFVLKTIQCVLFTVNIGQAVAALFRSEEP